MLQQHIRHIHRLRFDQCYVSSILHAQLLNITHLQFRDSYIDEGIDLPDFRHLEALEITFTIGVPNGFFWNESFVIIQRCRA